ncbi:DUF308 domain-containing protein [Rudanella lutea]|uniref:DUF308 domain-containing protein n=1 Tax=Rudanella lutea TaxID=451374 RepID=UPI000373C813|nr:DUF308 domain-containing protein [Rudanella lutea]
METTRSAQRWWLLSARGVIYVLIGVFMFVFSASYSAQSASIIGVLAAVAGILGFIFAFTNERADRNNIWGIMHGVADIAFGIAMFVYSNGTIKGFVDVLGFWAMIYAFLQSVQAMYVFMSARGATVTNYPAKYIHFANVLVSGGLAFTILMRPRGFEDSLGMVGIFPIILGALIVALSWQLKAQAERY